MASNITPAERPLHEMPNARSTAMRDVRGTIQIQYKYNTNDVIAHHMTHRAGQSPSTPAHGSLTRSTSTEDRHSVRRSVQLRRRWTSDDVGLQSKYSECG